VAGAGFCRYWKTFSIYCSNIIKSCNTGYEAKLSQVRPISVQFQFFSNSYTKFHTPESSNNKHGRQCTCNVTLRRVRKSLLPWKSNKYYLLICVCVRARATGSVGVCIRVRAYSLAYPAHNTYAPYCDIINGPWRRHICRHYLIKSTIFGKKLMNIKCVFWFSLQLFSRTFLVLRRI
jgi:hypothetical protein